MPKIKKVYLHKPIPSEYQAVEYIGMNPSSYGGSSSGPYINTGISSDGNSMDISYELDALFYNISSSDCASGKNNGMRHFVGVRSSSSGNQIYGANYNNGEKRGYCSYVNDEKRHTFIVKSNDFAIYIDGTRYPMTEIATDTGSVYKGFFYIGCVHSPDPNVTNHSGFHCKINIYGCKITLNGEVVRDYVPCYRKSDNVIGLYDIVSGLFYTNAGSGTFTKGANIDKKFGKNILKPKEIYCDFRSSDCGFSIAGNSSSATSGRDSNGFYVSSSYSGVQAAALRIPSYVYTVGPLKKLELYVYSTSALNGGGCGNSDANNTVPYDGETGVGAWNNILYSMYQGTDTTNVSTTTPANGYKITIDFENSIMYDDKNNSTKSIDVNIRDRMQSDFVSGQFRLYVLRYSSNYNTAYLSSAKFFY